MIVIHYHDTCCDTTCETHSQQLSCHFNAYYILKAVKSDKLNFNKLK